MQAIGFMEFGSPQVLQLLDLPIPTPADGEVVVCVAASTVNPSDLMMRSGQQAAIMTGLAPPYIAGMEFSGKIFSVGAGVTRFAAGESVIGVVNPRRNTGGAHAQYICVPAASVVSVDSEADLIALATVPMNGLTGLAALHSLGLKAGSSLLVTGGAGVLAGYVIQLAKASGIRVIADAKNEDSDSLRHLGADEIVTRGAGMDAAVRDIFPSGVDGLVDTALLGDAAAALVRDGGGAIALRRSHPITDKRLHCGYVAVTDHMINTKMLQQLVELLRKGSLKPRPGQLLPMTSAAQAHALMESGESRGRAILDFRHV
jgi:NADPH:quinone reductase-like Zn-dependent oxidoreductase